MQRKTQHIYWKYIVLINLLEWIACGQMYKENVKNKQKVMQFLMKIENWTGCSTGWSLVEYTKNSAKVNKINTKLDVIENKRAK